MVGGALVADENAKTRRDPLRVLAFTIEAHLVFWELHELLEDSIPFFITDLVICHC